MWLRGSRYVSILACPTQHVPT